MSDASGRVVAVVVTRNRRRLLSWCVGCLRRQTRRPDRIVVVNNGSSDDTGEWLRLQGDIDAVHQGNRGSGGGQAEGWRRALELGADWVWCMDDDGYPDWDALAALCDAMRVTNEQWLNSLVLDCETRAELAFWSEVSLAEFVARGELVAYASPFNGTLLHRQLIEKIGFPSESLFIWGDETEYLRRAQAAGAVPLTVIRSVFFHPRSRTHVPLWMLAPEEYRRHYYRIRNAGARLAADGRVELDARQARSLAIHDLRILWREMWRGPLRTWGWSVRKARVAILAAWAAYRNDLRGPADEGGRSRPEAPIRRGAP